MLRLFVAGASSPNPEEWDTWDEYSLVLAENVEQVKEFTHKVPVLEVDMSKPVLLCSMSEPNWGDDI